MVRFFQIFIAVLIIAFVGLAIAWNAFPKWLATGLTEKAGVSVTIRDIRLSPWSVKVDDFRIANPPRSILAYAFRAERSVANTPLTRFLHNDIVIPELTIDNIYLGVELEKTGSSKGNWSRIIKNFERNTKNEPESDRTVNIKRLVLNNLQIELVFYDERKIRRLKPIRRLEFENVGSEGGLPIAQITQIIMKQIMNDVIQKQLQNLLKDALSPGNSSLDSIRGLFLNEVDENDELVYTESYETQSQK